MCIYVINESTIILRKEVWLWLPNDLQQYFNSLQIRTGISVSSELKLFLTKRLGSEIVLHSSLLQ